MEDPVKHTVKRQLRRLATERPYQIVAASAAALAIATTGGALLTAADDAPADQRAATTVAEMRSDVAASRGDARDASPSASAVPSTAAPATSAASPAAKATSNPDLTRRPTPPKPPATKVLDYDYEAQNTYYNCGPAATRNALSATGIERTQEELGAELGTTEMGTNSALDTTRVLNAEVKGSPYRTRMFAGAPSPAQMDRLQADVVNAITDGRGVVANVVGDAVDTDGGYHSYGGGHYIAVVGYKDNGRTVRIADSANAADPSYWITTIDLANWIATRGYSA
ncbi:C39 family peptidase [Micromonospora sp. WMMD1120]|uniref:C39 family peptidase n=1 Tax=Micromonospora sp. WMMD1120 TaxID=3016106 RepID=UPI0024171290|nr:C39 family peptidase [Micromonospora sp. WMMD1120]MDG4808989.1 C39 family peptidase [Micromonospora sp. WMMD1120]